MQSCLGCRNRDLDRDSCGCIPAYLGRWRRPQQPEASSTRQAQRESTVIGTNQTTGPAVPRAERDQRPCPREDSPLTLQGDLAERQTLSPWPRTTAIEYEVQSVFVTPQTRLPVPNKDARLVPRNRCQQPTTLPRPRGPQHRLRTDVTPQPPAHSVGVGQISTTKREARHCSGAAQKSAQRIPGTAPVTGRPLEPFTKMSRTGDRLIQFSIDVAFIVGIAPKTERHPAVNKETLMDQLAENYNRQATSPRSRIRTDQDDILRSDRFQGGWSLAGLDPDPPTAIVGSPRISSALPCSPHHESADKTFRKIYPLFTIFQP